MVIRTCSKCEFHDIREFEDTEKSYCRKEGCWSEFSDCIIKKAIERFLKEETEYMGELITKRH